MISVRAAEFYSKINRSLLGIKEDIDFLKTAIPYDIERAIIVKILSSSVSTCGSRISYSTLDDSNLRQEYIEHFSQFRRKFRSIEFDRRINILSEEIKATFEEYGFTDFQTSSILKDLQQITIKYQDIIMADREKAFIVAFFDYIKSVVERYESLLIMTLSFKYCIAPDKNKAFDRELMEKISIYISGDFDVEEYISIISSMNKAYLYLAQVFPNATVKRLQYIKLETGSAFGEFFGDKSIMRLIIKLLSSIAQIFYHRVTNDGQLEKNGMYRDAIADALNLAREAEQNGIGVSEAKENISKALESATEELAKIVKKAPGIELNGEKYGDATPAKFLPKGSKKLLESGDDKKKQ